MSRVGTLVRRWWLVVLAVAMAVGVVIVAWTWASDQAAKRDAYRATLAAQNDRIIDCTTPGRKCYEDAQKRSQATLGAAFGELDCIIRRALAGLAAPDPTRGSCRVQTPSSVYPGGTP